LGSELPPQSRPPSLPAPCLHRPLGHPPRLRLLHTPRPFPGGVGRSCSVRPFSLPWTRPVVFSPPFFTSRLAYPMTTGGTCMLFSTPALLLAVLWLSSALHVPPAPVPSSTSLPRVTCASRTVSLFSAYCPTSTVLASSSSSTLPRRTFPFPALLRAAPHSSPVALNPVDPISSIPFFSDFFSLPVSAFCPPLWRSKQQAACACAGG